MPRIDPLELLVCLAVLLAPNGGIKSTQEAERIAGLMQKYSKKLVSKCIYIQILKCSETDLLGQFMETGGWNMTHGWLQEAIESDNWPLVQELLELLLLCPVDVTRLRSNSAPKLVKNLSKEASHEGVKILSARLVEQWLKLVKGETTTTTTATDQMALPAEDGGSSSKLASDHHHEQMLLDPTHLAMVGDELNGLGCSADIDVDEIIPTLNHHHSNQQMEVDGEMQPQVDEGDVLDSGECAVDKKPNGDSSSSSNNFNPAEKDNLKIKITMKDGKTKVTRSNSSSNNSSSANKEEDSGRKSSSSSSSTAKKSSSSSSTSGERSKDKKSSSSSKSSSSGHHKTSSSSSKRSSSSGKGSSSSSSSSSRDKDRSSSHKSSNSSSSSTSKSSSSRQKEAQADKDKDTLTKVMGTGALDKLGKIPKKPKSEEAQTNATATTTTTTKKSSISIEVRKDPENRPKTVKTFNSQFRNHGLVDDIPPPPSRKTLKKPTTAAGATTPMATALGGNLKRASPPKDTAAATSPISEKRMKLDQIAAAATTEEKPGGVKLIAPRSKPVLIESDMFMDALCSSATTAKGNPKKRKRRTSSSKDGSPPPLDSPKIIAGPMKFYQDTQEEAADDKDEASPSKKLSVDVKEEDDEENSPSSPSKGDTSMDQDGTVTKESNDKDETTVAGNPESPAGDPEAAVAVEEEMDVEEDNTPKPPGPGCGPDGPPGVLVIHRRKSAKKSVRWRPQEQLEEVRLFELDETERVNVTKTFTDMKQIERYGERDAFQMARKLQADDVMVEQTPWTHLIEVDDVPVSPHGNQSKERDIQAARELTCLQALYFSYAMIPDSASEPEMETIKYAEPAVIPLEDAQNTVNDFTKQGWPEPREAHGGINSFNGPPSFDPSAFGGAAGPFSMPPFGVPNQGIWNGGPPFGGGPPPTQYGGAMSNEEIKLAMNRLAFPGQNFNPPNFNGINMMNLPAMGAGGPLGGPPPGGWGFRGPPPNGIGGVWRGHGPPPGPPGAGPRAWVNNNMAANGGRLCKNFKKGFCKKGDKCNFLHPSGNGPPGGFNRI